MMHALGRLGALILLLTELAVVLTVVLILGATTVPRLIYVRNVKS
jgi:hypothetical protein